MANAQSFTEALSQYLSGDEWQQSIEIFVRTNCDAFADVSSEDYGHQHHALWKTFQDIVENILEMALNMVGGSIESLEKALDEVVSTPSRGPREDVVKDILAKLLSFDSFDSFASMMQDAYMEGTSGGGGHHNPYHHTRPKPASQRDAQSASSAVSTDYEVHYSGSGASHRDTLVGMGFDPDTIDMVLEGNEDAGLEQLVMVLSDMQAQSDAEKRNQQNSRSKYIDRVQEAKDPAPKPLRSISTSPERGGQNIAGADTPVANNFSALRAFASEAAVEEWNELNARFVTARSILDTFITGDTSDDVVDMVQWASDMVELYELIQETHENGLRMTDPTEKRPEEGQRGLVGWYFELEEMRKECADGAGSMLGDEEIIRMAELDRIAEMGTSDEQLLHSTITRHDEVQKDINLLHRRCGALCGAGDVKREIIEELYLYLKEKVATAGDLAAVADEMHEHVYSMVDSAKGGDIINLLLEMHVLEDEQSILRQKIDSMLGSPTHVAESKTEHSLFGDEAAESKEGGAKAGQGAKHVEADAKQESGGYVLHESKDSGSSDPFRRERAANKAKPRDEDIDEEALKAHVNNLKHGHKNSLEMLKQSLSGEKDRALSALEERLLRRKRQRDKEIAAARENGASAEELAALEKDLRVSEEELETEIANTAEHHDKLKDGICSGFKKRCIAEIKATQARGQPLNEEETAEAHRGAADALKNRFFRDQKNLQDLLEAERAKARRKIMFNLEKRKKESNGDKETIEKLEQVARGELDDMEIDFEQQELNALAGPQSNVLFALSGIHADTAIFAAKSKANDDGEDDEDFFDDDSGNVNNDVKKWQESIAKLREAYMDAGFNLQENMRMAYQGDDTNEDFDSSFGAIAHHMTQVITNAFSANMSDADAMRALLDRNKLNQSADSDRIKASILEEFERTREDYEQKLENARADAKSKLEKRKAKKTGDGPTAQSLTTDEAKVEVKDWKSESIRIKKTQAALETVVDNFLSDPIVIGGNSGIKNPSIQSYSAKFDSKKTSRHAQRKAERAKAKAQEEKLTPSTSMAEKAQEAAEFEKFKEEQAMLTKKNNIKLDSQNREKELIDALQVEMQKKKHRLEERLRRKKAKRQENNDDSFGVESELEDQQTQREIDNMEAAFEKAVGLLKRTDQSRLNGVNVSQLIDVMDRFSKKDSGAPANSAAQQKEPSVEDIEAKMEDNLSWELPAVSHTAQAIEARNAMETEVARISETYNEEKQKLDLMMKIQQARQKQTLQRKLLDRKQGASITQGMTPNMGSMRGGAGFSSSGTMATGGLGRQIPPLKNADAVRGLGAAGTMGLSDAISPSKDGNFDRNKADASRVAAGGMSMANFARK